MGTVLTYGERTLDALSVTVARRDARATFVLATAGYLVIYLTTIGDLSLALNVADGISVRPAADLSRGLVSTGFFRFEAIAIVTTPVGTVLVSPLNLAIALVLSGLVGANLALTYLGLVQPRACGLEASSGVFAGIPALLSGAACCGPTILLVVGIQASATLITVFQLLVPIAVVMLVGSLLLVGRQIDPSLL